MSKNILFISEQTIKDRMAVNQNIDSKLIAPVIKYCQDIYLEPILGTTLYAKIQTDIGNTALAGVYKTLVDDYITDVLLYYVMSELPMALGYKFYNTNVIKKHPESTDTLTMSELVDLASSYKNKAEYYEERVIRYLREQISFNTFPEYINWTPGIDKIRPKRSSYTTNIPLDDYYSQCCDKNGKTFEELYQGRAYFDPDKPY